MLSVYSDIIATGCSDKCVRVYYLATSIDKELKKFTGNISSVICTSYLLVYLTYEDQILALLLSHLGRVVNDTFK